MRYCRFALCFFLIASPGLLAQTTPQSAVSALQGEAISFTGELGSYGEVYSMSGRDARRPSSSARAYLRPTLSFYNSLSISANILFSTEGNSQSARRQMNQINQFGVQPRWKWGYINAGDFSESYTQYTLNGLAIRGGGFSINPGLLRLAATGGITRRLGATSTEGEFDREVYGGRIGVGREAGSFFDILLISVRDIPSKFKPVEPDTIIPRDSTQIGTELPYSESPQENLVVGVAGALRLFNGAFTLKSEAAGSAHTRDMNSPELENDEIPGFIRKLFTPRLSSSADFAYSTNLQMRLESLSLKAGYRYVGPGYVSLGVASLNSDVREISWGADLRRQQWSTSVAVARQNDNLLHSKLHTTVRYTYTGNLTARVTRLWHWSLMGNILTLRNHAVSDSALVSFSTITLGANQQMMLDGRTFIKTVGLNYLFTRAADDNIFRTGNKLQSHTVSVNSNMAVARNIWIVPMVSIVSSRQGENTRQTFETYSITPQWRTMRNRLFLSAGVGLTRSTSSTSLQTDITANYRLSAKASLQASVRRIGFNGDGLQGPDYGEYVSSIKLTQRL